jgi:hypothetical protein
MLKLELFLLLICFAIIKVQGNKKGEMPKKNNKKNEEMLQLPYDRRDEKLTIKELMEKKGIPKDKMVIKFNIPNEKALSSSVLEFPDASDLSVVINIKHVPPTLHEIPLSTFISCFQFFKESREIMENEELSEGIENASKKFLEENEPPTSDDDVGYDFINITISWCGTKYKALRLEPSGYTIISRRWTNIIEGETGSSYLFALSKLFDGIKNVEVSPVYGRKSNKRPKKSRNRRTAKKEAAKENGGEVKPKSTLIDEMD